MKSKIAVDPQSEIWLLEILEFHQFQPTKKLKMLVKILTT